MAQGAVIRDFLVALGFTTDKSKADEMKKTLGDVELKAQILNKAFLGLAVGASVAVTKVADELDKLYFSSQRIGASANNINAFGNAVSQMGGSAESALGTLESIGQKMRNSPGYEGMLNGLGIATKDANGQMRDRVEVMKDLSGVLQKMPAYQANAYANSLGIDQNTLLAMRDGKFISNMEKYQKIQKDLGMSDDLTKSGNEFMSEYRDLTMVTKTGLQVIVMQMGKALIPVLKLLNTMIQAGIHAFGELNPHVKHFLAVGLRLAFLAVVFKGLVQSFKMLKIGLSVIQMFIPALKMFRLAFLASPIGIILALAAALALLYDDYKTWKEGGKSFFDWSKWTGSFDKIISKIKDFLDILEKVKGKTIEFVQKIISNPADALKEVAEGTKNALEQTKQNVVEKTKEITKKSAEVAVVTAKTVTNAVKHVASGSHFTQSYSSKNFTSDKAKAIQEVAGRLGIDPNHLASVISFETGGTFSPSKKNPNSSATGLIQFMKGSGGTKGKYYGMTRDQFSSLSFSEQMKYVERYFKERGFKKGRKYTVGDVYGAVTGYGYKRGTKAYEQNKVWDSNGDGVIEKGEMVKNSAFRAHQRNYFTNQGITNINTGRINNHSIPNRNPHKSHINSSSSNSSSVIINQNFKTDMTINGAKDPIESANAVKRSQDNSMAIMTRNAQGVLP